MKRWRNLRRHGAQDFCFKRNVARRRHRTAPWRFGWRCTRLIGRWIRCRRLLRPLAAELVGSHDPMSKTETTAVGAALAVMCPLVTFVAFWWGSAAVGMYVTTVPDGIIRRAALVGLGLGVVGDVFFLRRWVAAFYTASWIWVAAVYLGLSIIAFAFCMGMPIGTFALGGNRRSLLGTEALAWTGGWRSGFTHAEQGFAVCRGLDRVLGTADRAAGSSRTDRFARRKRAWAGSTNSPRSCRRGSDHHPVPHALRTAVLVRKSSGVAGFRTVTAHRPTNRSAGCGLRWRFASIGRLTVRFNDKAYE